MEILGREEISTSSGRFLIGLKFFPKIGLLIVDFQIKPVLNIF